MADMSTCVDQLSMILENVLSKAVKLKAEDSNSHFKRPAEMPKKKTLSTFTLT